ncbi:MAG: Lrp/AsnC family transcriptional regulator [Pseudomonadales bacterium]|nr:Lrp/AsnC family transcriptional regulator [Pseudomonadales bacterium]
MSELDLQLIQELIKDPLASAKALATSLGASQSTIGRRIATLTEEGVIKVTVRKDFETEGAHFPVHLDVYVAHGCAAKVARRLSKCDEAKNIILCAGRPEICVRLAMRDQNHYADFLRSTIASIDGIERVETLTVLKVDRYRLSYARIDR